jgi:hypothetical protein
MISTHEEASDRVSDSTGDVKGKGDEDTGLGSGSGTVSAHEAENEGVGDTEDEVRVVDSWLNLGLFSLAEGAGVYRECKGEVENKGEKRGSEEC